MRISWLSAEEIAAARQALTADGATYEDHFHPDFVAPPEPAESPVLEWSGVTEHVARAERISKIVRDAGLDAARAGWMRPRRCSSGGTTRTAATSPSR